jgi:hypothetical protein
MVGKVFISYAHKDQAFIHKVALDLEEQGAPVWLDHGDLHGGMDWQTQIEENIKDCAVFILMISPRSLASRYVLQELDWALQYQKPVIPLFYQNTKLKPDLDGKINGFQYLFFNQGSFSDNFIDLSQALAKQGVQVNTDPQAIEARRKARFGKSQPVKWGTVLAKTPGWALAWSFGWALFWLVLSLLSLVSGAGSEDLGDNLLLAIFSGGVGGFVGGLGAGLFTMVALRRYADNISWRHMRMSIWIWGIIGPVGTFIVVAISLSLAAAGSLVDSGPCTGGFADCLGQGIGDAIGSAILLILIALLWALISVTSIGFVAGWFATRRMRKLEPGILARNSLGVMVGWGLGGLVSVIAAAAVLGFLSGS